MRWFALPVIGKALLAALAAAGNWRKERLSDGRLVGDSLQPMLGPLLAAVGQRL